MLWICLATVPVSFVISVVLCAVIRAVSLRRGLVDAGGTEAHKPVVDVANPNTGGVGVFGALAGP